MMTKQSKELSTTEGIQEVKWKEVSFVSQSENEANATDDHSKSKEGSTTEGIQEVKCERSKYRITIRE